MWNGYCNKLFLFKEYILVRTTHLAAVSEREVLTINLSTISVNQENFIVPRIDFEEIE